MAFKFQDRVSVHGAAIETPVALTSDVWLSPRNTMPPVPTVENTGPNRPTDSFHKGVPKGGEFDTGLMRLFRKAIIEFEYVFAAIVAAKP